MFHHGYRDRIIIRLFFSFFRLTVENVHPTHDLSRRNVTQNYLIYRLYEETKRNTIAHAQVFSTYSPCVQERTSRVIVVSKNNPDKIDLSLELRSPESLEIPRIVCEETTARWLANGDEIFAWKNTLILSSNAQTIPRGERPIGVVSKRSTRGAANPEARAPTRTTHTMQQATKKKINAPTLFLRSTPFSIRRNGVNHGKE